MSKSNAYAAIIEEIFVFKFQKGMTRVDFERPDIAAAAKRRGVPPPSNVGDVVYSARYRRTLPQSIQATATAGFEWIIRGAGRGRYCFVLTRPIRLAPNEQMAFTKVPDATPGVVAMYALGDEQALLARVRYNRLIDIFLGITCYSLQNHLRTSVPDIGQVETDELYVGIDARGCQYVIPVQ
ncbi:MAG: endonuclease, partial [Acidobacteria bacterium]|nr:endonuclease [Acidobacteriota bacterium]